METCNVETLKLENTKLQDLLLKAMQRNAELEAQIQEYSVQATRDKYSIAMDKGVDVLSYRLRKYEALIWEVEKVAAHYAALAGDDNYFVEECLEKAMDLREKDPSNQIVNPAGKFMAEKAIELQSKILEFKKSLGEVC